MRIEDVVNGLELLMYYNQCIMHEFSGMNEYIGNLAAGHPDDEDITFLKQHAEELSKEFDVIDVFLEKQKDKESVLRGLDPSIHKTIKRDLKALHNTVKAVKYALSSIQAIDNPFKGRPSPHLKTLKDGFDHFQRVLKRDAYLEHLLKEVVEEAEAHWEDEIKNKVGWLYHYTGIILLPLIKKHGLDINKLPKGIKRAYRMVLGIFQEQPTTKKTVKERKKELAEFELELPSHRRCVCLTCHENYMSGTMGAFPVTLYEDLNEEYFHDSYDLSDFPKVDQEILKIIWRFSRILRRGNRNVRLHIRVDSDFLKYLGLPDFIGDKDAYFEMLKDYKYLFHKPDERAIGMSIISWMESLLEGDDLELRVKKPIPVKFIFIEVESPLGHKLINISNWTPEHNTKLFVV